MKRNRHSQILDIIEEMDIETQEQLARELKKRDVDATQATVSRDIKELGLVKVLSPSGIYKYATIAKDESGISDRLIRVFSESVVSIESTNNLIVIKTLSGSAMAAASGIDALNWRGILGCIAGDDTILVIAKDEELVNDIVKKFSKLMKS
ncbi:MAG: arginine repressor [Clostridiales bacterium]|nr:arginine repressor [Clostridiales bacterium]